MGRSLPTSLIAILLLQLSFPTWTLATASSSDDSSQKEEKPCIAHNPSNGNAYDLNTITVLPLKDDKKAHKDARNESWHARGYDYGVNFTINFCAPVVEPLDDVEGIRSSLVQNISAFYTKGDKTYSIGQTSTKPLFRGRKLTLNYTDGSPCDTTHSSDYDGPNYLESREARDKDDDDDDEDDDDDRKHSKSRPPSSKASPRRKSTLISFLCDRESLAQKAHLSFIGASPDECTYFFEARSVAACGGVIAQEQSVSPGGVFGMIALIAAAVYLLGGIAYQRTVMHQRGWRQVPNYALWAGILGFFKDVFIILTSSCTRCLPRRKGYNQLSSRSRRDDEANGLIDSYDEEY